MRRPGRGSGHARLASRRRPWCLGNNRREQNKLPPAAIARGWTFISLFFFVKRGVRRVRTGWGTTCLGRKPKHNSNARCSWSIVCQHQNCPWRCNSLQVDSSQTWLSGGIASWGAGAEGYRECGYFDNHDMEIRRENSLFDAKHLCPCFFA